jgi:hypothetical protein
MIARMDMSMLNPEKLRFSSGITPVKMSPMPSNSMPV